MTTLGLSLLFRCLRVTESLGPGSRLPITLPILDGILEPSIKICHTPYDSCLFKAIYVLTCLFHLYADWWVQLDNHQVERLSYLTSPTYTAGGRESKCHFSKVTWLFRNKNSSSSPFLSSNIIIIRDFFQLLLSVGTISVLCESVWIICVLGEASKGQFSPFRWSPCVTS